MKKKRILYSELASGATPAPVPPAPVSAAPVPATPVTAPPVATAPASPSLATPAQAGTTAPSSPVSLPAPARALSPVALAARVAAEAKPVAVPPSPPVRPVAPAAPRFLRDQARARSGRAELLLFRVGEERFGIELAAVEEAIDIPPVHHVPEMPPSMLGVITVRGTLTSVYSPAAALGLTLHDGTSALIFRRGRSRVAIVVDEVDDVATLDLSSLRDAPALDAGDGVILGVVRQGDILLALVDADPLMAACQAASLLEIA